MKKTNIVLLSLGYLAGLVVALKFSKDGKGKNLEALAQDIKKVHTTLWTEGEKKVLSLENREKIAEMKAQALSEITEFKNTAESELKSLVEKGELKSEELMTEAAKLYDRRSQIIDDLLQEGMKFAESTKSEGEDVAQKLMQKVATVKKDLTNDLNDAYKSLKKKLK